MGFLSINMFRTYNNNLFPRDYYYDKLLTKYENPEFYSKLDETDQLRKIPSKQTIRVKDDLNFGISYQEVIDKHGKPNCILKKDRNSKFQILFYRVKVGGHKTKCEYHFYNNRLFFFTYIFAYLTKEEKNEITKMVGKKYADDALFEPESQIIIDVTENFIMVENGVDYSILYVSGEKEIFQQIKKDRRTENIIHQKRNIRRNNELYRFL
ncbi:MAG: hypothetical protein JW731_07205 [Bacteroidales bacterium]|nr:hypothetical protein [Bacteroidales bacterium]